MKSTLISTAWALSALLCVGCSKTPVSPIGGNVGSETHWLTACEVDADCDTAAGAACLCGLCTVTCADDAACEAATGLSSACVGAQDAALVRACGGTAPAQPVCVATCATDAECADGTACDNGRCLPSDEGAGNVDAGMLPAPREQTLTVPGRPKMDVLVVVDNSGSMCEEQGVLAAALRGASPGLADLDLRFAVVSTDLRTETDRGAFLVRPTTPEMSLTCPTAGGPNAPDTAACDAALAAVDLRDGVLRAENGASAEALAAATSCLVTLGTLGDGFEKGLEAMRLALSCEGPQRDLFGECCRDGVFDTNCAANPAFLRPDAGLLVVVLSDEADCSDPSVNPRASRQAICKYGPMDGPDADTLPEGYADPALCSGDPAVCYAAECGALNPDDCYRTRCIVDRGDNENCLWHSGALTPVADYADFLRSLKPRGGLDVRVLPLVGPAGTLPTGEPLTWTPGQPAAGCDPTQPDFDPATDAAMCCPDGACTGPSFPVCVSDSGRAYSGARYRELGQAFCEDPADCEALDAVAICDDGFELGASIDRLLARVQRLFCLEVRPDAGESIEVSRDGTVLPAADYRLEDAAECATGRALRLLDPLPGASYVVRVLP